jgi:hypothetical protein
MPTDININLANNPGSLAQLGEALGGAGINIQGIACLPVGDAGSVHILVEDAAGARSALEGADIEVLSETEAVVVNVDDSPGKLGELARAAADAGVNLDVVYLATNTRMVLVAEDTAALRNALG